MASQEADPKPMRATSEDEQQAVELTAKPTVADTAGEAGREDTQDREEASDQETDAVERNPDTQDETSKQRTQTTSETSHSQPPLPDEPLPPPLPDEPVPEQQKPETEAQPEDDGWAPLWDESAQAFYFYNRFTGISQWENPRVPEASTQISSAPGTTKKANNGPPIPLEAPPSSTSQPDTALRYNPAIHGDYDPTAPYAQKQEEAEPTISHSIPVIEETYAATGSFNRFTGRWQDASIDPSNHNDESKSRRQMNAFFDVDAAANSHDGRSLRAERAGKKLSKAEIKAFREKRREKKEEKRRAWLRD